MRRIFIAIVGLMIFSAVSHAAGKTTGKHSDPQVVYALPKTVLAIEVELERTETKVGPYYRYANRYLRLKDVATEDQVTWRLKSVNVKPAAEPDKEKTFKVSSARGLWLNEKGIICGLNIAPQKAGTDSVGSYASKMELQDNQFDPSAYYEEQISATSDSREAELAAQQIYRIREARLSLATGDLTKMPSDGKSMQLMFDKMDKAESSLMSLFVGKKSTTTVKKIILYTPAKKSVGGEVVFRVSKKGGVVGRDDLSGTPVYISITAKKSEMPSAVTSTGELFYNLPGSARVELTMDNQTLFDADLLIAQMGSIQALPASYKSSGLRYNPITGALVGIESVGK